MTEHFHSGDRLIITEQWHDHLWSAQPHLFVSGSATEHITYVPHGTTWACATNRGLPEVEGFSREQRKLEALASLRYRASLTRFTISTLHFFTEDTWSRVNLGWTADGEFTGWYVNFELPPLVTDTGIVTKDLVLDLTVDPAGTPHWKDREDFDIAVERGVLGSDLRPILMTEGDRVLDQLSSRSGPFAPEWTQWRPPAEWGSVELPDDHLPGGSAWHPGTEVLTR